jgi:putative transposase
MARKPRVAPGGIVYHVLNRGVGRRTIFRSPRDFDAFEKALHAALDRFPKMRLLAYCLMGNHWHLVLWPAADAPGGLLSRFMQWLTVTHTRRWHAHRRAVGEGALYQGRFRSFPVQQDQHLLIVIRYVERNALRARLVRRAQDWPWSSLHRREHGSAEGSEWLLKVSDWPCEQPPSDHARWTRQVNEPQTDREIEALRRSIGRGSPFGSATWAQRVAARLNLQSSLRDPWRPRRGTAQPPRRK